MSDVATVAEYIYFKNSTLPSSTAETFGNTTEETNGTFIGNLTATNSTLTENGEKDSVWRDLLLIGGTAFICIVILIAQFMNILYKSSSGQSEEASSPSQVVTKYRARFPTIDEEEGEQETEFGATTSDTNAEGEQAGGEIRKTEALVPCTSSKPKKPKKYTPLPFAWDFDGKIVAQIETEYKPAHDDAKDSENQTTSQEIDNEMTTEQLDQLKDECKPSLN